MKAPLDGGQGRAFGVLARWGSFTQTARELPVIQQSQKSLINGLERTPDVGIWTG